MFYLIHVDRAPASWYLRRGSREARRSFAGGEVPVSVTVTGLNRNTRFLLALAVLATALACHAVFGPDGAMRLAELRSYESALDARAFTLLKENQDLREKITRLGTDDSYLETVARKRLGLARPDEIIYRFDRKASAATPGEPAGQATVEPPP